jgi:hypothetical protein
VERVREKRGNGERKKESGERNRKVRKWREKGRK